MASKKDEQAQLEIENELASKLSNIQEQLKGVSEANKQLVVILDNIPHKSNDPKLVLRYVMLVNDVLKSIKSNNLEDAINNIDSKAKAVNLYHYVNKIFELVGQGSKDIQVSSPILLSIQQLIVKKYGYQVIFQYMQSRESINDKNMSHILPKKKEKKK